MIRTDQLSLKAGTRTLVDNLNWSIRAGECWSVIGRNGAGKSTLLRSLAGLREPDAGQVTIQDRALKDWPLAELARERAFLAQARHDAFSYSVIETVLSARHPYHDNHYWEGSDDQLIALTALASMEVDHLAARDVRSLSGGERQRVAIAAMLAQDTPLLLLDEPANALDLAHQVSVMGLLAKLCREQKKTVVMVGHDLNLAHSVSTHALLLMGDGSWLAGPVAEVMQASILGDYLGHPIEIIEHGKRKIFIPKEDIA
ncbi:MULTISPECIES: ABC transporter ATP-binding protein [unclassified Janthinobacterium]|uniref:ABC transporter ATP-binding protein n=1 Tax=unclassified Janthinobacterium TaxID=2610881 RepID=UPI001616CD07|nr:MULTISPECIES: ABC transporter ATP-binding protein [unclassified Janthinobacterium]MBB5610713.1 iron complex transport system ATP-binding protein [Janthinobacterium sp. S3T4]MBB5616199.1 iron complex transport system ATP-binding protein [Janthinobacterium sp. S3M3]